MRRAARFVLQPGGDLFDSRVGGKPFLPQSTPYPHNEAGDPLLFLAQVNFSQMPKLDGFPASGLLSFFIGTDEMYGLDLEQPDKQDGFRVLYFSKSQLEDAPRTDFGFLNHLGEIMSPLAEPFQPRKMHFHIVEEALSLTDYRFAQVTGIDPFAEEAEEIDLDCDGTGHKVGGYASFTQEDPRTDLEGEPYELLLQLDMDLDLMWGDSGVGNFFIRPSDLAKLDFTRVLYNWDCL
ncbi:MAG: DUF1963 domain-containing protein [Bryobacterales bacterium]|nr:DUF1963 domain-containing protein [Bryobacterales bacterium]